MTCWTFLSFFWSSKEAQSVSALRWSKKKAKDVGLYTKETKEMSEEREKKRRSRERNKWRGAEKASSMEKDLPEWILSGQIKGLLPNCLVSFFHGYTPKEFNGLSGAHEGRLERAFSLRDWYLDRDCTHYCVFFCTPQNFRAPAMLNHPEVALWFSDSSASSHPLGSGQAPMVAQERNLSQFTRHSIRPLSFHLRFIPGWQPIYSDLIKKRFM